MITLLLIAVNVFVYFAVQPHDTTQHSNRFTFDHAAIPCEIVHGHPLTEVQYVLHRCSAPNRFVVVQTTAGPVRARNVPISPGKNVYLAIVVSMFLHASLLHLLGNMLFLWIFGNNVEDRLGSAGYLLFYFAAGILATVAFTVANAGAVEPLVGASGAIAGVMGAYLIWFPKARILTVVFLLPFYLPAAPLLLIWFVTQFFTNPNSGVAWVAHVAGFVFGALVAYSSRGTAAHEAHAARRLPPPPPPPLPGPWPGGMRGLE